MTDYFVSSTEDPHTSTGNAGTLGDPMGVQEALDAVVAGDTVLVMDDGAYLITESLQPSTNGSSSAYIKVFGANSSGIVDGSTPDLNASAHSSNVSLVKPAAGSVSHYHFKSLKVNDRFGHGFLNMTFSIFESLIADAGTSWDMIRVCERAVVVDCSKIGGFSLGSLIFMGLQDNITVIGCRADSCKNLISGSMGFQDGLTIHGCYAKNCSGDGFDLQMQGQSCISITDCIATGCGGDGFNIDNKTILSSIGVVEMAGCIAYDNTGDGLNITNTSAFQHSYHIVDCLLLNNGGYGIKNESTVSTVYLQGVHGRSNTSGLSNGTLIGEAAVALTVDPFTDAANSDFTINDTAGGGAVLRAVRRSVGDFAGPYPFRKLVETLGGGGSPITIARIG